MLMSAINLIHGSIVKSKIDWATKGCKFDRYFFSYSVGIWNIF